MIEDLLKVVLIGGRIYNAFFGEPGKCLICEESEKSGISFEEIGKNIDNKYSSYVDRSWIIFDYICEDKLSKSYKEAFNKSFPLSSEQVELLQQHAICRECCDEKLKRFEKDFTNAYIKMNTIKTYPASYRGTFNLDEDVEPKVETYDFSGGKWNTVNMMKFWAVWKGYNIIYNITYDYENETATGVFAKLKNN